VYSFSRALQSRAAASATIPVAAARGRRGEALEISGFAGMLLIMPAAVTGLP